MGAFVFLVYLGFSFFCFVLDVYLVVACMRCFFYQILTPRSNVYLLMVGLATAGHNESARSLLEAGRAMGSSRMPRWVIEEIVGDNDDDDEEDEEDDDEEDDGTSNANADEPLAVVQSDDEQEEEDDEDDEDDEEEDDDDDDDDDDEAVVQPKKTEQEEKADEAFEQALVQKVSFVLMLFVIVSWNDCVVWVKVALRYSLLA